MNITRVEVTTQFHPELPLELIPRQVEDFTMDKTPCCFVLRKPESEHCVVLNLTGALVWQMCEGRYSVGEIIEVLKEAYPDAAGAMDKDVFRTLDQLYDEGVVTLY